MLWNIEQKKWPSAHREGGVGIWTFPTVFYHKKKHNCFKIAMQELKNKKMLVLMWMKCQHLKPNNHRVLQRAIGVPQTTIAVFQTTYSIEEKKKNNRYKK
jgi:hypothetical protein